MTALKIENYNDRYKYKNYHIVFYLFFVLKIWLHNNIVSNNEQHNIINYITTND